MPDEEENDLHSERPRIVTSDSHQHDTGALWDVGRQPPSTSNPAVNDNNCDNPRIVVYPTKIDGTKTTSTFQLNKRTEIVDVESYFAVVFPDYTFKVSANGFDVVKLTFKEMFEMLGKVDGVVTMGMSLPSTIRYICLSCLLFHYLHVS